MVKVGSPKKPHALEGGGLAGDGRRGWVRGLVVLLCEADGWEVF